MNTKHRTRPSRSGRVLVAMWALAPIGATQARAVFDFDVDTRHPLDVSGSGVRANVHGNAQHTSAGYEGGAFELDGVDDWIEVALNANPHTSAFPQFSMGAFVRVDTLAPLVQSVLSTDDGNYDRALAIDGRGGTPRWSAFAGGACGGAFAGPGAVVSSSWRLVAVVYDRFAVHDLANNQWGMVRLYVDGVEQQAHACPGKSFDFVAIGKNPGFGEPFQGAVDNVFFFSGILSKAQLDQIRTGGKAALLAVEPDDSERERFQHDGFDPDPTSGSRSPKPSAAASTHPVSAGGVILPAGNMTERPPSFAHRTTYPGRGWARPDFDDSSWARGPGGFGYPGDPWEQDRIRTPWTTRDLYVRTTFELSPADLQSVDGYPLALWGRWTDYIDVFINGVPALIRDTVSRDKDPDHPPDEPRGHGVRSSNGGVFPDLPHAEGLVRPWRYRYVPISKGATQSLVVGENTLAIHAKRLGRGIDLTWGGYLDMGVVRNPFDGMPATGFDTLPGTDGFLKAARRFAAERHVPTLSFAVRTERLLLAHHTIGYLDKQQTVPAPLNTYFRIASLNKMVTAACIQRLVELAFVDPVTGHAVTLDAPFWRFLEGRLLSGTPASPLVDSITIRQMLEHRSGIGHPPFPELLYEGYGHLPRMWQVATALYEAPPFFDPGTGEKYSNEAYFLLNFLVRLLTGDTEAFIETQVVRAAAVGVDPMILSTEELDTRADNEAWYRTRGWPFDRWLYLDDYGHLSVTAPGYLRFLTQRIPDGSPLPSWGYWWYFPGGEFEGTTTNAYQRILIGDVTSFILLTNTHDYLLAPLWDEFIEILDTLPDAKPTGRR